MQWAALRSTYVAAYLYIVGTFGLHKHRQIIMNYYRDFSVKKNNNHYLLQFEDLFRLVIFNEKNMFWFKKMHWLKRILLIKGDNS